jgi:hypothetical protein
VWRALEGKRMLDSLVVRQSLPELPIMDRQ